MKIIGIDPGYERLGIALIESTSRISSIYINSQCFKTKKELDFNQRLSEIVSHVTELILQEQPEALVIELLFFNTNQKTALFVSEVRGALKGIAILYKVKIFELTPLQIKSAITGHGQASKDSVAFMIPKLIKLPDKKMIDDEMDAIAIALAGIAHFSLY